MTDIVAREAVEAILRGHACMAPGCDCHALDAIEPLVELLGGTPTATRLPRAAIHVWDIGQQPDMEEIGRHVTELSGGRVHLHIIETCQSDYAVVIADAPLDPQAVDGLWMRSQHEWVDGIVEVSSPEIVRPQV